LRNTHADSDADSDVGIIPAFLHETAKTGYCSVLGTELRASWNPVVDRRIAAAFMISAALGLFALPAHAGPCTKKIAQFERTVRQSAENPTAGPMAPQSIGAQLGHQPTPSSVKRADIKAQKSFDAALTHAKTLDEKGKRKCVRALAYAKRLFNLQ
jgi:hypothetical protein